jgi:hypothetical protein
MRSAREKPMPPTVQCLDCMRTMKGLLFPYHTCHKASSSGRPLQKRQVAPIVSNRGVGPHNGPTLTVSSGSFKLSAADRRYSEEHQMFLCWPCGAWIPNASRRKHMREHGFDEMRKANPRKLLHSMCGCLLCEVVFEDGSGLRAHLVAGHPNAQLSAKNLKGAPERASERKQPVPQVLSVRRIVMIAREDPAQDVVRHVEPKQRGSLDGSVRYGVSYREQGSKFGSHSSHDDYGEESEI